MNANESIYLFAVWARGTHFSMLFGNNSSDVCWTQIRMTGVLLCTTRCIHRTHSKLGRSSPLGVGMHLCFFVCHYFCTRMQTKCFKYFVTTWELMCTGSSQRAMTFSTKGHVVAWGLDLGGKISPSEMHGQNCNPQILETVRPRANRSKRLTTDHPLKCDHQCAH